MNELISVLEGSCINLSATEIRTWTWRLRRCRWRP